MAAVAEVDIDAPAAVKERLDAFAAEMLAEAMNRPVQIPQRWAVPAWADRAWSAQVARSDGRAPGG